MCGPKLSCAPQGTVSDGFDGSGQTQVLYTSSERKENDFEAQLAHHYRYMISLDLVSKSLTREMQTRSLG